MFSAAINAPGVSRPRRGSEQDLLICLSVSSKTNLNGSGGAAREPKASPMIGSTRSKDPASVRCVRAAVCLAGFNGENQGVGSFTGSGQSFAKFCRR